MSSIEILQPPSPILEQSPSRPNPFVEITEQPYHSVRFRYSSEEHPRRPRTIYGASSTPGNKIPFAIKIVGYEGRVIIVVCCVTKDQPHKPHPIMLVGPNCRKGVCVVKTKVTSDNPVITFPKVRVQKVKRRMRNVRNSLRLSEVMNVVHPFLRGFGHSSDVMSIDLNVMRLCFHVFFKNENRHIVALAPVVSLPIYNRKTFLSFQKKFGDHIEGEAEE